MRADEAARGRRAHVWCVVRPRHCVGRRMHHGTVDAVRRQVLHGEHVLPEGVLLHLPHRGLLAMRALTLTRRLTRAHDVPLSSGDGAAPTVHASSTCTGDCELRCARCVLRSGPLPTSLAPGRALRAVLAAHLPAYVYFTPSQGSANRSASGGVLGAIARPPSANRLIPP